MKKDTPKKYIKNSVPDYSNLANNRQKSKKRAYNKFSVITDLIRKWKETKNEKDMLEILTNLSGIINTYTLILTPTDIDQKFHITKYMKRFIGMFFTEQEKLNPTDETYFQVTKRLRFILKHYEYEDLYSKIIEILIEIITKMKIIGTCDCIFYIQMLVKFRLHKLVIDAANDSMHYSIDTYSLINKEEYINKSELDVIEDVAAMANKNKEDIDIEDELINNLFYNDIDISILFKQGDIYTFLSKFERYLLYLKYGLGLSNNKILSLIKHLKRDELSIELKNITKLLTQLAI